MEQERQLAKNIITDFIGLTFVESIEKNLFEYSKESKNIYMNKLKYIFEIINPKSKIYNKKIISDIKKKINSISISI